MCVCGALVMGRRRGRAGVAFFSVILAKRGSPGQGRGSALSLPWQNHLGDSRAERENDVQSLRVRVVTPAEPFGGFPRGARE